MSLLGQIARTARGGTGLAPSPRVVQQTDTAPPLVLGWNRRDALFEMDPRFATILDNYVPREGFIELRPGYIQHATGLGGSVETLFSYRDGSTSVMLGAANGSVFDVTASGPVGAAIASGFTSNRWQAVNFFHVGLLVNGADPPQTFDGTTLVATTLAAAMGQPPLTVSNLIGIHVFKRRVFYIENNTSRFWFHAAAPPVVSGDLTAFDLSDVHPNGGNLIAIGTLTNDGGQGVDDLAAFFMETGDVLIYQGTDPGDAAAWSLIGIFTLAPLLSRRGLLRIGADLIAMTTDGYIPVLQFLKNARSAQKLALSDAISGEVSTVARQFAGNFGWEAAFYPRGNLTIFNVPSIENAQADQHVSNTITNAWCRFKNLPAITWQVHEDRAYFGGPGGIVYQFDEGLSDDGNNIIGDAQGAFIYFGGRGRLKRFFNFRPNVSSDSAVTLQISIGFDFADARLGETIPTIGLEGGAWNTFLWNDTFWAGGFVTQNTWRSADGIGQAAAIRVRTQSRTASVRWFATNISFEVGGLI